MQHTAYTESLRRAADAQRTARQLPDPEQRRLRTPRFGTRRSSDVRPRH